MCFLTVVLSAILWLQAPSVVLTDYQIFTIITFLLVVVSIKKDKADTSAPGISHISIQNKER